MGQREEVRLRVEAAVRLLAAALQGRTNMAEAIDGAISILIKADQWVNDETGPGSAKLA